MRGKNLDVVLKKLNPEFQSGFGEYYIKEKGDLFAIMHLPEEHTGNHMTQWAPGKRYSMQYSNNTEPIEIGVIDKATLDMLKAYAEKYNNKQDERRLREKEEKQSYDKWVESLPEKIENGSDGIFICKFQRGFTDPFGNFLFGLPPKPCSVEGMIEFFNEEWEKISEYTE